MDIEKLIERLRKHRVIYKTNYDEFSGGACTADCVDAADIISTLQAENAQLRADLEYEREHANAYYQECGQWEAENEKLLSDLRRLQTERDALLAANQRLLAEREQLTAERDAAVSDIETALAYGMKDCELCKNSQCYVRGGTKPCLPKWRGIQNE